MKFDINIFIITCTVLVSIVGLCVVVWSFITTRLTPKTATGEFLDELLNVPDNPNPAIIPEKIFGLSSINKHATIDNIDYSKTCTCCIYGDLWQKGHGVAINPCLCGAGYKHRYVRLLSKLIDNNLHTNWIITDSDGNQIDCGKWEERN